MRIKLKGKRKPTHRIQDVMSKPRKLIGTYLTPKGERLFKLAKTEEVKEEIREKYQKNRYSNEPRVVVKQLVHEM